VVTFEYEADGDPGKVRKFWRRGRFFPLAGNLIPHRAVVYVVIYT
jgi:hypothetical protein